MTGTLVLIAALACPIVMGGMVLISFLLARSGSERRMPSCCGGHGGGAEKDVDAPARVDAPHSGE